MNRNKILILTFLLVVTGCVSCFKDEHNPPKADGVRPGVDFTIDASNVITENFLGFGTQYNNNLFTSLTAASDGVTDSNLPDLRYWNSDRSMSGSSSTPNVGRPTTSTIPSTCLRSFGRWNWHNVPVRW